MPRNVRNFWLDLSIDGRKTNVSGGPVSKDGGFMLRVRIRDAGSVREAGYLRGYVDTDGALKLEWDGDQASSVRYQVLSKCSR